MIRVNTNIPEEIEKALLDIDFSKSRIRKLERDSELLADLKISGDSFEALYQALCKHYNSERLFPSEYIPSELSNDSFYIAVSYILPRVLKNVKSKPLTLDMIDRHMRGRKVL